MMGDQRLSASKIFALPNGVTRPKTRWCPVINAFRHQRFLHRRTLRILSPPTYRDQRLLASKIFALANYNYRRTYFLCDQRLSASKIFARACPAWSRTRLPRVINAFRHQRFLHFRFRVRLLPSFSSDQRLSASKIFAPRRASARHRPDGVINAFRHQRFLHSAKWLENTARKK